MLIVAKFLDLGSKLKLVTSLVKVKLTKNSSPIELMNNIIYSWYIITDSFNSSVRDTSCQYTASFHHSFGTITTGDNHVVCWSGGTFSITFFSHTNHQSYFDSSH